MGNDKSKKEEKTGSNPAKNSEADNLFFPQKNQKINNQPAKTGLAVNDATANNAHNAIASKLGSKEFEEYKKKHAIKVSFSQRIKNYFKKNDDKKEDEKPEKPDSKDPEKNGPDKKDENPEKKESTAKIAQIEKISPKDDSKKTAGEAQTANPAKIPHINPHTQGSKEFEKYYQQHKYDGLSFSQKLKKFFSKNRTEKEEVAEVKRRNREKIESLSLAKSLMAKNKKKKKIRLSQYDHIKKLKNFLEKSGISIEQGFRYLKLLGLLSILITFFLTIYLLIMDYYRSESLFYIIAQLLGLWIFFIFFLFLVFVLLFFVVIDFRIYARKKEIESVLADYLQLTSANVSAGMPIDQALWLAIRPKFGILAKEMEDVAKATMSGEDLKVALTNFANKYDSFTVKRSVSILIEGMESGGKIGPLLDKISINIQDTALFKKEMAANVTTYVIFITFASIVAAPFLFALSYRLMTIITKIMSNVDIPQEAASSSMFSMGGGEAVISQADFMKFIILALMVTALFSAMIISIIQKGTIKDGIKYIPIFIAVSLVVFFIANFALGIFFAGIG